MVQTKKCSKCHQVKSITEFYKDISRSDGLYVWCKSCLKAHDKARRDQRKAQPITITEKTCTMCNETKPASEYPKDPQTADGLHCYCKSCDKACGKAYRDQKRAQGVTATEKTCSMCNETKPAEEFPKNSATVDGLHVYCKSCQSEYNQEYQQEHPEAFQEAARRYRARKVAAKGSFTQKEFEELCEAVGNRCIACGANELLEADHIVPLSEGGSNDISNIQPLCRSCNASKGTQTIDYLVELKSMTFQIEEGL